MTTVGATLVANVWEDGASIVRGQVRSYGVMFLLLGL